MVEETNGEVTTPAGAIDAHEPCPPYRPAYIPPVVWPRTGAAVRAIIIGEGILALWRHWADGTTPPCTRKWGGCRYCDNHCPATWCVYLPVLRLPDGKRRVLMIPEAAYQCCELLKQHEGRLRGWGITAQRLGDRPNSPCIAPCPAPAIRHPCPRHSTPG
jgi:hypothetical protein